MASSTYSSNTPDLHSISRAFILIQSHYFKSSSSSSSFSSISYSSSSYLSLSPPALPSRSEEIRRTDTKQQ
ncbi:hypothetical protein E2C01_008643 [Portunus trituberculatus]|uniref:Uncharacterized protein n=1 Tax=Portunus trituberculatus TaxID=210409 RepID=A0A5B7D2D6_PORTR|nr:hypothetical protein [Portunus trituberculatus]